MAQNVFSFLQYKKQLLVTPGNSWSHLATPGNICISSGHPWQLAGHIWQLAGGHIWQHILGYISCLESRQLTKIGQKNHNSFSTLATPGHTWQQLVTPSNFPVTYDNYLVTSGNILFMPNNFLLCLNIFCSQIVTVCDTRQLLVTIGNNLALVATAGNILQQSGHIWQQVIVNTRYWKGNFW